MEVRRGEVDGVAVLELRDVLDAGAEPGVEDAAACLLRAGPRGLVIDLAGVDRVYPGGLVDLVRVHQAGVAAGVRPVFAVPRAYLRELLHIIRLDRVLHLAPDMDLALAEVGQPPRRLMATPGR